MQSELMKLTARTSANAGKSAESNSLAKSGRPRKQDSQSAGGMPVPEVPPLPAEAPRPHGARKESNNEDDASASTGNAAPAATGGLKRPPRHSSSRNLLATAAAAEAGVSGGGSGSSSKGTSRAMSSGQGDNDPVVRDAAGESPQPGSSEASAVTTAAERGGAAGSGDKGDADSAAQARGAIDLSGLSSVGDSAGQRSPTMQDVASTLPSLAVFGPHEAPALGGARRDGSLEGTVSSNGNGGDEGNGFGAGAGGRVAPSMLRRRSVTASARALVGSLDTIQEADAYETEDLGC